MRTKRRVRLNVILWKLEELIKDCFSRHLFALQKFIYEAIKDKLLHLRHEFLVFYSVNPLIEICKGQRDAFYLFFWLFEYLEETVFKQSVIIQEKLLVQLSDFLNLLLGFIKLIIGEDILHNRLQNMDISCEVLIVLDQCLIIVLYHESGKKQRIVFICHIERKATNNSHFQR